MQPAREQEVRRLQSASRDPGFQTFTSRGHDLELHGAALRFLLHHGRPGSDLVSVTHVLPNGATLYFLGTNARTAQSYHGNLNLDEYFWIQRFQELRKIASGMAIHAKWRQTHFSTPSSLAHEAYPF